jgi:hypothetical protein
VTRVPAALAVLLLAGSGILVKPATLCQWRKRGHIGPGPGYDLDEIVTYIDRRGRLDVQVRAVS